MVFVYITCKDKKEAKTISRRLLKERLIACANILPISSLYLWKGKIVDDSEFLIFAKTIKKHYPAIKKEVSLIHSYEVPCICALEGSGNKSFMDWVKKEVK